MSREKSSLNGVGTATIGPHSQLRMFEVCMIAG